MIGRFRGRVCREDGESRRRPDWGRRRGRRCPSRCRPRRPLGFVQELVEGPVSFHVTSEALVGVVRQAMADIILSASKD